MFADGVSKVLGPALRLHSGGELARRPTPIELGVYGVPYGASPVRRTRSTVDSTDGSLGVR